MSVPPQLPSHRLWFSGPNDVNKHIVRRAHSTSVHQLIKRDVTDVTLLARCCPYLYRRCTCVALTAGSCVIALDTTPCLSEQHN
ncbi:hypothetical protein J6590_015150 [Homalodisca vitripennis]|nr:hypothetical protein J6590_015150 [Homalodisca vitripennis]